MAGAVFSVDYGPGGKRILTGGNDGFVKLWNVKKEEELITVLRKVLDETEWK